MKDSMRMTSVKVYFKKPVTRQSHFRSGYSKWIHSHFQQNINSQEAILAELNQLIEWSPERRESYDILKGQLDEFNTAIESILQEIEKPKFT